MKEANKPVHVTAIVCRGSGDLGQIEKDSVSIKRFLSSLHVTFSDVWRESIERDSFLKGKRKHDDGYKIPSESEPSRLLKKRKRKSPFSTTD